MEGRMVQTICPEKNMEKMSELKGMNGQSLQKMI